MYNGNVFVLFLKFNINFISDTTLQTVNSAIAALDEKHHIEFSTNVADKIFEHFFYDRLLLYGGR